MRATDGTAPDPTPLLHRPLGEPTLLCAVSHSDPATRRRLAELGLRRGTQLTVLHRTAGGGRVIAAGDLRLALDKRVAASLLVVADGPAPPPATVTDP